MPIPSSRPFFARLLAWDAGVLLPWIVLVLGTVLSLAASRQFDRLAQERAQAVAAEDAALQLGRIEDRLRAYVDTLHALRGFMDSSPAVDAGGFGTFVRSLRLQQRYPELLGMSFARLFTHAQRPAFEAGMRQQLRQRGQGASYAIVPAGDRPEYLAVEFAESATHPPYGLDLLADPLRRPALERARSSGTVTSVSGVVIGPMARPAARDGGLVMWLPVYHGGHIPETAGHRHAGLRGTVGLAVDIQALMRSALGEAALSQLRLQVQDTAVTDAAGVTRPGRSLFDNAPDIDAGRLRTLAAYAVTRQVTVAERAWVVTVTPLDNPRDGVDLLRQNLLLAAMLATSLLSAWVVAALQRARHARREMASSNEAARALIAFGEDLHACGTRSEHLDVLFRHLPRLLAGSSGVLYEDVAAGLRPVVGWGELQAETHSMEVADCQALRRGHPYHYDGHGSRCEHVPREGVVAYLCLPMSAAGELIGLLHARMPAGMPAADVERLAMMAEGLAQQTTQACAHLRLRERLLDQALHDRLTGLYNRHYMMEWLQQELHRAERTHGTVGAVMIDIDRFKAVNDLWGHAAGDLVLRRIGELLRAFARRGDVACRYGGEEFLLLLSGAPPQVVRERAEQLRREIAALDLMHDGRALGTITVSAGVATYPDDALSADALLRRADNALYAAKAQGRNRVAACGDGARPAGPQLSIPARTSP